MSATLHLARYSVRDAVRMLRGLRSRRRALAGTPGLATSRLFPTVEFEPVLGGRPTPTRWAYLCGWDDTDARDAFFVDPAPLGSFLEPAREAWSVSLETVRVVNGEWQGWLPDTEGIAPLDRDEPLAVLTYGKLRPRYVPRFMVNNRRAVRQMLAQPGVIERVGLGDGMRIASTFSLWSSQGSVVRYAYGPGPHKPAQRLALDTPWGNEYFFARFRPLASRGSWNGRDPLAQRGTGASGNRSSAASISSSENSRSVSSPAR